MPVMTTKQFMTTVTALPGTKTDAEMLVTTEAADRVGDRMIAAGVELDAYRQNPVLLWSHQPGTLPLGTVTGLDVVPGQGIRAQWRWLQGDDFAARVKNAWTQNVLRAASIGFIPLASRPNDFGGRDFTRWELLEISLVGVPANSEATRQLKGLGLLGRAERSLTLDDGTVLRETELRALIREQLGAGLARRTATLAGLQARIDRLARRGAADHENEEVLTLDDEDEDDEEIDDAEAVAAVREYMGERGAELEALRRRLAALTGRLD